MSYWLSAIGRRLSAISHNPPTSSQHRLRVNLHFAFFILQ
jgi:hypothetical protein